MPRLSLCKPAGRTSRFTSLKASGADEGASSQRNRNAKLFRAQKKFFRFSFHPQHASESVPASVATARSLKLKSKKQPRSVDHPRADTIRKYQTCRSTRIA